jgi:phosphoserine phosphatase
VITFLVQYRAFLRLMLLPVLVAVLIPLSKVARTLAVRLMYWFAFRGINVKKAQAVAADRLGERYANDLQDPAASAVLKADEAVVITASPDFMARPWLERFLGVPAANVFGAVLEERNGRFTGRTFDIPIGEKKVELLKKSGKGEGASTTGYGDHPTDLPFLQACDKGVLVQAEHEVKDVPEGIEQVSASPFPFGQLPSQA